MGYLNSFAAHQGKELISKNLRSNFLSTHIEEPPLLVSNQLHILATHVLGTYIVVPLIHNRVCSSHFQPLLDWVRMKLGGWRTKLLSRAAKLILLQT